MAVFPFQYVNRRGIPVIKTTGVTVNAADVVFSFQNHAFANSWYRGIVLVELSQAIPAGTTGTLPVLFETNGVTKNEPMSPCPIFRGRVYSSSSTTNRPTPCN
jgi:hypothetical protein